MGGYRPKLADDNRKLTSDDFDKAKAWLQSKYEESNMITPGQAGNKSEATSEPSSGTPSETLLLLGPYYGMAIPPLHNCWPSYAKYLTPVNKHKLKKKISPMLSQKLRIRTSRQQQSMQDGSITQARGWRSPWKMTQGIIGT